MPTKEQLIQRVEQLERQQEADRETIQELSQELDSAEDEKGQLEDQVLDLECEERDLADTLTRMRDLHRPPVQGSGTFCEVCGPKGNYFPCDTLRLLEKVA